MSAARPNILLIMTDEERYTPPYERDSLAGFRAKHMPARAALAERGTELHRHYAGSTACIPSRATLFTGQYPSLHGVRNTDGLAKSADDPQMLWLDPDEVPTLGDWFRAAGYQTHYRGKWHVSNADLPLTGTKKSFLTNTRGGEVIEDAVAAYETADRLEPWGFSGWIGPDPHGIAPANTGMVRDGLTADQVTTLLATLACQSEDADPWLTVASFVNPHDISFTGMGWEMAGFPPVPDWVPSIAEAPSQADSLAHRPRCQEDFRKVWGEMLYPQPADENYRRLYHWLLALVDEEIAKILASLEDNGLADNTIVVFTSDHGDLLGAHGGLQQKWHNAYEEAVHVPLVFAGPGIEQLPNGVTESTSHVDLLPTLLGLAGSHPEDLITDVGATHTEAHAPVGRDLSGWLTGSAKPDHGDPVYFMTEDQVSRGLITKGIVSGEAFKPVGPPSSVESVIAEVDGTLWKLNHYYDATEKTGDEEWELHDLSSDPEERTDRSGDTDAPLDRLRELLLTERSTKRLEPVSRKTPGPLRLPDIDPQPQTGR